MSLTANFTWVYRLHHVKYTEKHLNSNGLKRGFKRLNKAAEIDRFFAEK